MNLNIYEKLKELNNIVPKMKNVKFDYNDIF